MRKDYMPGSVNISVRQICRDVKQKLISQWAGRLLILLSLCMMLPREIKAANETFTSGAFIINMGVTPQTIGNGIKPYGLIYDLIRNNDVPIKWVISQTKVKDGIDFTHNGISYRGGTFIICAEYRTAAVNAKIAAWQAKGVVGATSVSSMILDVTRTLRAVPNWAMDADNGDIAIEFLEHAEIPAAAYYFRTPATLNSCDNLYVMPHADPEWDTHSNLFHWNKNSRGAIWAGCHAVSAMEGPDCVNPLDATQNLKFLSTNGLVRWTNHNNPTAPYSYSNVTDPVFQMMGLEDAAHNNGSERVYLPLKTTSTWNPSVKIGCYDATQSDIPVKSDGPAALTLYGYAFNDTTRGMVMYQSGHDLEGTGTANVASMRQFFNWSFLGASQKEPRVTYTNIPSFMIGGTVYNNLTANATSPVGFTTFTYQWSSTAGGVFSAPNAAVTNYTPPATGVPVNAKLMCKVIDPCGRYTLTEFSFTNMPPPGAPIAYNDSISYTNLCSVTTQTINVLSNDYDEDGDMVNSITIIANGVNGTFVNNGNGSVTYNPGWSFQGIDSMVYEVCDTVPMCSQGKVYVTTGYSGPCSLTQYQATDTARADSVIHENSVGTPDEIFGIADATNGSNSFTAQLSNDADSLTIRLDAQINTGDTIYLRAAPDNNNCIDFIIMGSTTSNGFVNGVNSSNRQVPAATQHTFAWYTHIVTAPTRYIRIKINPSPCDNKLNMDAIKAAYRYCTSNVPVAVNNLYSTSANVAFTANVKANDTDPAGGALSITVVSQPPHGTATVNGAGNIVYTPDSAYSGADSLIYRACNTSCLCDTAIVRISVIQYSPCSAGSAAYYRSGHASSVTSSSNTTNPTNATGAPDAVDGSNALTARINNVIGADIVLDLNDTIYAGDTIVVRMAPDNNSANSIRVQGNISNAWGAPTTTTDFNLPINTSKVFANYSFILNANTRYIRVVQTSTTADVDLDALTWDYWHCTSVDNRPPAALNDSVSTYSNRPVYFNVSANDVDPDNNTTSISIIAPAANDGTPVVTGSGITYTPDFGFIGNDTVTYSICDNGVPSLCDTAYLVIYVLPGPPVAMLDSSTMNSNSFVNINVQANDTLPVTSYSYTTSLMPLIMPPTNGSAVLVGNNIQYTPDANFTGLDSLVYQICDNGSPVQCDTAKVYITVTNQFPVAVDDVDTTSACNSVIINAVSNDTDPESGVLTITSVSTPSNGTTVISNNQIVYTPNSSPVFTGTDSFYYFICDNGSPSRCDSATVNVVVNSNNPPSNPPDVVDDNELTRINQAAYISVLDNDSDPDLDSIRVDSTAIGLMAPNNGYIDYLPNGLIMYMPDPGFIGVDSFEYRVCDIHNNGAGCVNIVSSCATGVVTVTVFNAPPAANDNYAYTINTVPISNTVALNDFEPDGQNMTYSVITPPVTGGIVMNADGSYTFTPDGVFVGIEAIEYIVCDDAIISLCDTATLYITIDITNVPPNPQADTIWVTGITPYNGSVATNDTDPNGNIDPNGFSAISGPNYGDILFNLQGDFTYTADTGFIGIDYFYYEVCDLGMPIYCSQSYLTIFVNNLPPVAVNGNDTTSEDAILNVNAANGIISNGDYDPNALDLHVNTTPLVNPSNGNVTVNSDGSYSYTPDPDFNGTDFFVVDVCDDSISEPSICTPDTTFILVTPVNDPPVTVNDTASGNEDNPINSTILTAGDVDPDTTALTVNTTPVVDATNGNIVVNVNGTYTYTPDPDFNGTDTIVLSVCDSGNPMPSACTNDTLVITVNAVNDPPVTTNESNSTNEDTPVGGTVITGADTDLEGTALSADTVAVSGPSNGTIDINTDGTYTYTPDPDFNGTDVIVISICDSGSPMPAECTNDTLTITVNPVNDAPVTVNDTASTNEDNPVSSTILTAGDVDPDSTALTVNTTPVVDATNGNIVVNVNGTYTYTPDPDFNGTDTIVLSVCDSGNPMPSACTNDTLVITVNAVNDPPVTTNESNSTNEDTPVGGTVITGADTDQEGTALSADTVAVSGPSNGTIDINTDGTYTYTPDPDFNGTDVIVISICDSGSPMPAECTNDTLTITVNPVNDAPVTVNDTASTNEDNPVSSTILTAGDVDPDSTALTVNTTPVVDASNGNIVVNVNGTYTYTPDPDFNGTDTIVLSVCDAGNPMPSACTNDTLVITINPVNDAPVLMNDTFACMEDSIIGGTVITTGDIDIDGTVLTADTVPVLAPANGTIDINTDGTFTYTPSLNYFGNDTAIISVCDAGIPAPGICVNDTLFITVYQTNDPPIIANDTNTTAEDNAVSGGIITASDIDPDSLTLTVDTVPVFGPTNGIVSIDTAGNYTYTPDPNFNGIEIIVFNVCDQGVPFPACTNDTLMITVTPVNDTAVIVNDVASGNEDTQINSDILTAADFDIDTTALTVDTIPLSGPSNGIILMNTDGTFSYWPNQDFNGTDVVIFNICDSGNPLPSICIPDTLIITVNPVNDPPVTSGGTAGTNEDNPVSGNFLGGGDVDPDSTALVVDTIPVSGPSNGTIDIDSTGSYTYTPDPDFNGTDTVIVSVCDNGTPLPPACTNDTIIITVNPINDNPTANSDNTLVCSGDTLVFDPLANDSDIDLDSIFISSIIQPVNGIASTDGVTITYIPNAGYHGVDSISYDVCDNGAPQLCATTTIYIDVNGPISSGIQANEVLCFGDSTGSVTTAATFAPTFTYLWNTGDTTASIFNVPAGFYSVTITDSLGCSIMDTATVMQPPQLIANGNITDVLCFGNNTGAIDLTVTGGSPNFSYLWNNGDTIQDLMSVPAGSYDVEVTDNNGCISTYSATISQPSAGISVIATIDSSDCLNNIPGLIDVTVSGGTAGYQYAWDNSATSEDITDVAGNYVLIVTDNNSCTDTSSYTIFDNSNFTISTYDSTSFCQGDSIRLSADYINGSFQWMFGGVNISGATDSVFYANQTGTYSLSFVNACGSFVSNDISADVNVKPVLNASGGNEICEGAGTQFTVTGANTYSWSPAAGLNNASVGNPFASPVISTDYTVTGYIGGCSEDTILSIVVHPLPVVNITSTPFDCDLGAQLSATAPGVVSYQWSPGYGLDSVNIATPYATPVSTVTYTVLVTDSFNCSSTATLMIFAQCDSLFIPNGITPDDDGSNDTWIINGINRFPDNKLKIFNRWGNIVYKAGPYQNDWKGTCIEKNVLIGEDLPDGTYFYILELGFGYPVKTGFIELRR